MLIKKVAKGDTLDDTEKIMHVKKTYKVTVEKENLSAETTDDKKTCFIGSICRFIWNKLKVLSEVAVLIALVFTLLQHIATIAPILENKKLIKAQACVNCGEYSRALAIYRSHRLKDNSIALNNIGYLYEKGLGVEKNTEIARSYYREAAVNGSKRAIDNLIYLDLMDYSDESKEELVKLFCSAYEMKDERLAEVAILCVYDIYGSNDTSKVLDEDYNKLFNNGAELFRKLLFEREKNAERPWKCVETIYSTSSGKANYGETSKYVLVGAESGISLGGDAAIYYKYEYYERPKNPEDYLDRGFEILNSL